MDASLKQAANYINSQVTMGHTVGKGSYKPVVRSLQVLLYDLGFERELNWDKYRADGGYGGSTTNAVNAFMSKNEFSGAGTSAIPPVLQLMLIRQSVVHELRALKQHIGNGTLDQFSDASTSKVLSALGIEVAENNISSGLSTFAQRSGISFSGSKIDKPLGEAMITKLSKLYGEGWATAGKQSNQGRLATSEFKEVSQGNTVRMLDDWFSIKFIKSGRGVYTVGEATPATFIKNNREELVKRGGLTNSAVRVILPVSGNEGNLDAINTYDDSFMTFGMFQWTLGQVENPGELAGLINRIKEEAPESVFKMHFGKYGLDVTDATKTTGYLTLNGQKMSSTFAKNEFRKNMWSFRFWKAGLDPWVQLIQVKHAVDRINSFRFHKQYMPLGKHYIGDYITSEYGMCLILDHSVNRPGHLMQNAPGKYKDRLGAALQHAGLANSDPSTWGTAEEMKLINAYLPLRAASSMTHGKERADKITALMQKGELSKERHSFDMPKIGETRSLGEENQVEQLYPVVDPEEYEGRE